MKQIRPSREILILGTLILILGGVLISRSARAGRSLPDWSLSQPDAIERILVETPDGSARLKLEKREERWYLPQIDRFGGNREVDGFLQNFRNLQPVNLLSEKGSYSPYGLNETQAVKIKIIWRDGEDLFYMGNLNETGSYTYFRKEGDPSVYTVRGNWQGILETQPQELRNRRVFSLDSERIQALSFHAGDRISILEKRENIWYRSGEAYLNQQRVNNYVRRLSQLNCQSFPEDKGDSAEKAFLTVTITTDTGRFSLELLEQQPRSYLARSEGLPDDFLLNSYDGNTLMELSGF